MSTSPASKRHSYKNHDGDEQPDKEPVDAELVEKRHCSSSVADREAGEPGGDNKYHKDMNFLHDVVGVLQCIDLDDAVAPYRSHTCSSADPGKVIPPASEEANNSAKPFSWCDGGPVVYACAGRHGTGKLGEGCGDEEVEE